MENGAFTRVEARKGSGERWNFKTECNDGKETLLENTSLRMRENWEETPQVTTDSDTPDITDVDAQT
jgi:hypothetical protein